MSKNPPALSPIEREFSANLYRATGHSNESQPIARIREGFIDLFRTIVANAPDGPSSQNALLMMGERLAGILGDMTRDFS